MRIVSLVPSSTETLLDLGADVVACTRFCEQPDIAHVGGTKNPDIDAIVALNPDLVVLDREENRREDAASLTDAGMTLFISDVNDMASALQVVDDLAEAVDRQAAPGVARLVEPLGLNVFVPIWRRPWMSINRQTYGASLLDHLGCTLVTADLDAAYPEVTLDDLANWAPDIVAVPSEPYEFTDEHLAELQAASPSSAVVRVDGQDLFWWGSRTPDAIARLHHTLGTAQQTIPKNRLS
jgi:ABC-type Fe3+-hydroxamate transport system substrate-binding protein